jgi:hypothetical protein
MNLTQTKVCKTCNFELELDKFSKGQGKYKKANVCKLCDAERRRMDYATLPSDKKLEIKKRQKVYEYKRTYGLPDDIAWKLANSRKGVCVICNETKLLVVDHCHTSGAVRGLICSHCNSVLGYAKDNIKVLENAIKYLEESK